MKHKCTNNLIKFWKHNSKQILPFQSIFNFFDLLTKSSQCKKEHLEDTFSKRNSCLSTFLIFIHFFAFFNFWFFSKNEFKMNWFSNFNCSIDRTIRMQKSFIRRWCLEAPLLLWRNSSFSSFFAFLNFWFFLKTIKRLNHFQLTAAFAFAATVYFMKLPHYRKHLQCG